MKCQELIVPYKEKEKQEKRLRDKLQLSIIIRRYYILNQYGENFKH